MGVAYGSWMTFAGFSLQRSRILLCVIAAFSSSVLRCLGGRHHGGIRHLAIEAQSEKPLEREPVLDLELGRLVQERVERLQHQNLEHHHRVKQTKWGIFKCHFWGILL